MKKQSLQQINDNFLIANISHDIVKTAGLFETLGLDSAASSIKNLVQEHVGSINSPLDILETVGNLLLTGTLFKIHPVLGIGYSVAEALGVDIKGLISQVIDAVRRKINGGSLLSENEFNSIAKTAGLNPALLIKEAAFNKSSQRFDMSMFGDAFSKHKPGVIERVFGNLFDGGKKFKATWLAKGLIIWVLKTALLGAGLLIGTGVATKAIKGLFNKSPNQSEPIEKEHTTKESIPEPIHKSEHASEHTPSDDLSSTLLATADGFVEKKWKNDDSNIWIVDLSPGAGTIEGTLLAWTEDIYPELGKFQSVILNSPSFDKTVSILRDSYSSTTPNSLVIPVQFHSRKQIVDSFAPEIAKDIAQQIGKLI